MRTRGRRSPAWQAIAVALTVGLVLLSGLRADTAPPEPGIPSSALSPAGTKLFDGLTVPQGAELIGTPLRIRSVFFPNQFDDVLAVLTVSGDPVVVWGSMLDQLAAVSGVVRGPFTSCADGGAAFECVRMEYLGTAAPFVALSLEMRSMPGDVTGRYSITITRTLTPAAPTSTPARRSGRPPAPEPARQNLAVGSPLAPQSVAYPGDNERYVLLHGSELLILYSTFPTGGFRVILRIASSAQVEDVAASYARQAKQNSTPGPTRRATIQTSRATIYEFIPPGGSGGYQGYVWGVDNDVGDDYIYYSLGND